MKVVKKLGVYSILLALVFVSTGLCAQADASASACLKGYLEKFLAAGSPGAELLVQSPEVNYSKAIGFSNLDQKIPLRTDQPFRIASTSKSIIGALAAILKVDGKLDLDNTDGRHSLADYLPE